MPVISFNGVNKSYGGYDVLKDVSFELNADEKVALIGRNGTGKTTIFNIIASGLEYDGGQVYVEKCLRIGYLRQLYTDLADKTAEAVIEEAFSHIKDMESELKLLSKRLSADPHNADLLRSYGQLSEKFEFHEGYSLNEKFNKVTKGLGIPDDVLNTRASKLSGGELTMIMLAKVLLMQPDILLLDEPTNHLDCDASDWLEKYINEFKGTVLYISHDRYFIDNTAMKVLYLQNGGIKEYRGNYSAYLVQKTEEEERHLKLYERQEREMARLRATALKMRNYGTEIAIKRAKNLEKRISRMDIYDKPVTEKELKLTFLEEDKVAKEIFSVKNIEKSFGSKTLFKDISFVMRSGDRIALIGPNGAGKTTLIKIITGQAEADSGILKRPKSVKYAYPSGWMKTVVGVDRVPKPAYFAFKEALIPLKVNLRCDRRTCYTNDVLNAECWILNDTAVDYSDMTITAVLYDRHKNPYLLHIGNRKAICFGCGDICRFRRCGCRYCSGNGIRFRVVYLHTDRFGIRCHNK
jgi:ATP-binding cassette subfamily F protein 3